MPPETVRFPGIAITAVLLRSSSPAETVVNPVKVLATEPESVNVPVPDLVRAIFPVPSVIASVKPDGLAVPLTVRVLVVPVPPLLVIEPPPAPEVKDAIS